MGMNKEYFQEKYDAYSNKKISLLSPEKSLKKKAFLEWYKSTKPKMKRKDLVLTKVNR